VPWLTSVFSAITQLGNSVPIIVISVVALAVLAWRRRFADMLFLLAAVLGAHLITTWVKLLVARHRPVLDDPLAIGTGFSFPSGHALVSTALYGAIALLIAAPLEPRARRFVLAAAVALVGLIGFSRLYLGVHYLSDVLAGFAIGLAWLALLSLVLRRRRTHLAGFPLVP
jgi:undecaprenyl-diphosphatase